MTEPKPTYEANSIPQTLGEVLRALCAPFPEEQCGWRILSWNGPGDNWVWVRYPYGDYMKLRLAQSASGGYDISYEDTPLEDRLFSIVTLVIYDPERPTEHKMTLVGVGEKELEAKKGEKVTDADVVKAAHTYALKDALEQTGMGVGVGRRAYTLPYTNPDGDKTDKYGIPLSEYENGTMRGPQKPHSQKRATHSQVQRPSSQSEKALTNADSVRAWLTARAEQIDTTNLSENAYAKHAKSLAKTLEKMGFDPKQVMDAAWGDGERTVQQVIAVQGLIARKASKEILQHLVN